MVFKSHYYFIILKTAVQLQWYYRVIKWKCTNRTECVENIKDINNRISSLRNSSWVHSSWVSIRYNSSITHLLRKKYKKYIKKNVSFTLRTKYYGFTF